MWLQSKYFFFSPRVHSKGIKASFDVLPEVSLKIPENNGTRGRTKKSERTKGRKHGKLRFNNTATLMPVIPEYMTAVIIHAALLHQ